MVGGKRWVEKVELGVTVRGEDRRVDLGGRWFWVSYDGGKRVRVRG